MAPNGHSKTFMSPTEIAICLRVGKPSFPGKSDSARQHVEMTVLSVDSGSCGIAPCHRPVIQSPHRAPRRLTSTTGAVCQANPVSPPRIWITATTVQIPKSTIPTGSWQ
jgi:hypothetical protein